MKKLILILGLVFISTSCQSVFENSDNIDNSANYKYSSDAERFKENISVKGMGDGFIVYEYTDVRIDDVSTLAAKYCYDTDPTKKAYLRDIYMYKNHKRRATFDCVDLASM